jgi:GT2 family glycosyltransferase
MGLLDKTSVIIVTYNHREYMELALKNESRSIFFHENLDIIVVDNNSSDGTADFIEEKFPEVTLIRNTSNIGFGSGINQGVQISEREYLVILNPDTMVGENSIEKLVKPLLKKDITVTIPQALLYDSSRINTCGNIEHFTGLSFTRGLGGSKNECVASGFVNGLSGVCFAIRRDDFMELGGFDQNFFLYMEDVDLSWRIISSGLKILYIPQAVIYHDYVLEVPPEKIYHLEKGRYIILRKYFTWKELIMFLPSLIVTEIFTWGYSMLNGSSGVKFKCKAIKDGLSTNIVKIDCNRKELLQWLDFKTPSGQLSYIFLDKTIRVMGNFIYMVNYHLILKMWDIYSKINVKTPFTTSRKESDLVDKYENTKN